MKIVYLMASTGAWGGLEKHVFELASAMAERGHAVTVMADASYQQRCPAQVALVAFNWKRSRWNPRLWFELRRTLNQLQPDIIHAHAAKAVGILAASGWPCSAKSIGTVHNVKSGYRAYRKLDAVIAVSAAMVPMIPHAHVTVIHNGIRNQIANPATLAKLQAWRSDKPSPLLLAIGRLVPAKGFDLLLQAWPVDAKATLVILGEGPERAALENTVAERALQHVHLPGESSEITEWLASADMLVISSRNEGGPYVLAEALLAGLPVISTDVGMVSDFLPESCMLPCNDVAALSQRLSSAIADTSGFKQACLPAMASARQQLTLAAMAAKTEQVYEAASQC